MTNGTILKMPPGFLWGAATAAHQNEGGNENNQWAAWEREPGRIHADAKCGISTNWWDLETAAADFDRAVALGMNSLRISVEWSRIEPEPGLFDGDALRHYVEMLRLLRARGLEPMVTLHHFTDPLWLTARGGWESPLVEEFFVGFVTRVVEALGDQATRWCTINEPTVYAYSGYLNGGFPPGANSLRRGVAVLRRMILTHGRAYRTIHRLQSNAHVGLAHHWRVMLPRDPASATDRRAATALNRLANVAIVEAAITGQLKPPLGFGQRVTQLMDTSDFIGLNYYTPARVSFDPSAPGSLFMPQTFATDAELSDPTPLGEAYGEIDPTGLYQALKALAAYGRPIYITENGVPDHDDDVRPRFIATHLAEAWRAVQEGADLRGYYHWTLVDNFEWAAAWSLRFGLIALDPATGARTIRPSAAVYERIARANGIPEDVLREVAPGYLALRSDG